MPRALHSYKTCHEIRIPLALLPRPLLTILCRRVPVSRGLAGEGLCMATGMELQACLGGLPAALAALAVLEGPGRIWQQEEW